MRVWSGIFSSDVVLGGSSQLSDPIADSAGCQRDLAEFKKLGVTVVDQSEIWQQLQAADLLPR